MPELVPDDTRLPEPTALEKIEHDAASRKRFLRMVGGAGAASLATLIAACGSDSKKSSGGAAPSGGSKPPPADGGKAGSARGSKKQDLEILNYALTLEYLEADFYKKAGASGMLKGAALKYGKEFGKAEATHVKTLTATIKMLGGTPAKKPKTKFPLESQDAILQLAATVENLGAAAYLGQAGRIMNPDILAAALSIHSVEARHASALNVLTGKDPVEMGTAFAKPASMEEVLPKVMPFIVK